MHSWETIEDVLDFAIGEEIAAQKFYTEMAERMTNPAMKEAFIQFAREERGHEAKLKQVKAGKSMVSANARVQDLGIADYLVEVTPSAGMAYEEALQLAMQKEKAAFKLYSDLAGTVENAELKELFLGLAQEEAKHKLRFEIEYDDNVLAEN